jgi:hypothetical protein
MQLALRLEGMDRGSERLEDCCVLGLDAVIRVIRRYCSYFVQEV